ncbi:2-phospho-L-lactate guanylyltransferase [Nocardioides scoriae]|uniref:Phosphoenolpyruvate guanylyltransferase n=1 Tax=Nocardioides scoriae TaxID=642780 RepID=A0A1H1YCP6_9ACTN|nr:2-phospho-L-lactate guanylyltransferase [Nocardioides scoriae]SDT19164.1 2-phospho-L-lactate guanylyltransferase [Nocardioides scoriae]
MSSFVLLLPVKTLALAKSRLAPRPHRDRLMRAFALDALHAAGASEAVAQVYAVTAEAGFGPSLPDLGEGDLNAALRHAALEARLRHPGCGVAAMCADLPALAGSDLTAALRAGMTPRWYVADAEGTGTTLLAAGPGVDLDPHFGVDSAGRHERSGATPVRAELTTLRCDVDTPADLDAAIALGVGAATRATLASAAPD